MLTNLEHSLENCKDLLLNYKEENMSLEKKVKELEANLNANKSEDQIADNFRSNRNTEKLKSTHSHHSSLQSLEQISYEQYQYIISQVYI